MMEWIFVLTVVGGIIWLWQSRRQVGRPPIYNAAEQASTTYILRGDSAVEADEVFYARNSGDFPRMLSALELETNPIDRHFLLMSIVNEAYKKRSDPKMADFCASIAEKHISEFPKISVALKKDMGEYLPRVTTFQYYATLLSEQGKHEKAIEVCRRALEFGLRDNTKSGFEGRIDRIKKKQAKKGNS